MAEKIPSPLDRRATRIVLQFDGGIPWPTFQTIISACAKSLGKPDDVRVHGSFKDGWTVELRPSKEVSNG